MLRVSRLITLALSLLVLHAGALGAYMQCLEGEHIYSGNPGTPQGNIQSISDEETAHCFTQRHLYGLVKTRESVRKAAKEEGINADAPALLSVAAASHLKPIGRLCSATVSMLLYPSVAIYQSNVVYRI